VLTRPAGIEYQKNDAVRTRKSRRAGKPPPE